MPELKNASLPCPIHECLRLRKPDHAMCWGHWRRVPHILQQAFWQGHGDMAEVQLVLAQKEGRVLK
jgi:hypothetical protein